MKLLFEHLKTCPCVWVTILFLFPFLANGCSSVAPKELLSKRNSESFSLVLVRPSDPGMVRLPVNIDNHKVKLKRGSFLALELSPGMHSISARHGYLLGHDFPPASTNVSGSPGESRYFLYVMQYSMFSIFPPTDPTFYSEVAMRKPYQAVWKEITQQEFERLFPNPK
jgi:hypothetical protein